VWSEENENKFKNETIVRCDVESNRYCKAMLNDNTVSETAIECQCSLFNRTDSYCQHSGQLDQIYLYFYAQALYYASPLCRRELLPQNPLLVDLHKIKQCSSADRLVLGKFEEVYWKLRNWAVRLGYSFDEKCWEYV